MTDAANARLLNHAVMAVVQQPGGLAKGVVLARANVQRFPKQGLCWKTLGALLWWQGEVDEALAAMQTAARLLPGPAPARRAVVASPTTAAWIVRAVCISVFSSSHRRRLRRHGRSRTDIAR